MPITINGSGTVTGISAGGLPDATITPAELTQPLTLGTVQASTSGTNIDFTGIPSWVKRVTVMFDGVSVSGTSVPLIQLGDSGGIENTGYNSAGLGTSAAALGTTQFTTGFGLADNNAASDTFSGLVAICLLGSNIWTASGSFHNGSSQYAAVGGSKTLSGTLDRIRITTVNGTDTFDAGSINILYE